MKEPGHNTVSTADLVRKRKKRRGSTTFTNSKQRRRNELKKKELSSIEGRETPSDLSEPVEEEVGGSWRARCRMRSLNLLPINEEAKYRSSPSLAMAENEQRTNSNQSDSNEERREDSVNMVS